MATPFNRRRERGPAVSVEEERDRITGRGHLPSSRRRVEAAASGPEPAGRGDVAHRGWSTPKRALTAASKGLKDLLAQRSTWMAQPKSKRTDTSPDRARQIMAWDMYDQIGELREATHLIADAVASADLYVGRVVPGEQQPERVDLEGDDGGLMPEEAQAVEDLLRSLVESGAMERMATQLFVGAETFLLGVPADLDEAEVNEQGVLLAEAGEADGTVVRLDPVGETGEDGDDSPSPLDEGLVWHALSFDEITLAGDPAREGSGERGDDGTMDVLLDGEWHTVRADRVVGIAIWQAHPRRSDRLDSGVLSALPILLQLVAVGQYAQAAIDSRLAGAGVFVIPASALNLPPGATPEEVEEAAAAFMEDLTDAMVTPIEDRSSASAVVPIVVAVKDESTGTFQRIEFGVDLSEVVDQREEHLIRRMARSLDLPPEQVLGVADMNHWSAWQVDEATVKAHVEPMLRVIVTELTSAILWPTLTESSEGEVAPREWAIGFDTSRLVLRPNRGTEAQALYDRDELSGEALRRSMGFDEGDAPATGDAWTDAVQVAIGLVTSAPSLAAQPGLEALAKAVYALGTPPPGLESDTDTSALEEVAEAAEPEEPVEEEAPEPVDDSATPDTLGEPGEPEAA